MTITRVNLPLLLRAAICRRNANALHRRPHHISPASFLHSHPSNTLLSNPHPFSTSLYRRVYTRATASLTPLNLPRISSPSSLIISKQFSRGVHAGDTALNKRPSKNESSKNESFCPVDPLFALAVVLLLALRDWKKPSIQAVVNVGDTVELSFVVTVPHMYRMGHSVVVEGVARPITENKISNAAAETVRAEDGWELYISATEVVPNLQVTAKHRNTAILATKQICSDEENDKIHEILAAANHKVFDGEISTNADDLSKRSESKILELVLDPAEYDSLITTFVTVTFDMFRDLPKLLGEGHSVFIKGFIKGLTKPPSMMTMCDEIKKVGSDEINKVGSDKRNADKWPKTVTGNNGKLEYHFLAEAILKDDVRYMPRDAAAIAIGTM